MNVKTAKIDTLRKRLHTLAFARIVEGETDKTANAYSQVVAELSRRTRKPAQQIRTAIRRKIRRLKQEALH